MATKEKPKTPRGRRAYLNDFQVDEFGRYVYIGKLIRYTGGGMPYRRYRDLTAALAAAAAGFTVLAECLPSVGMSRAGLPMIPWAGQLVTALLLAWAAGRTILGGDPLREYIYKKSAAKLPGRAILTAVFAFAAAAAETVYILAKGFEGDAVNTALRPVCSLACGLAALGLYRLAKRPVWAVPGQEGESPS